MRPWVSAVSKFVDVLLACRRAKKQMVSHTGQEGFNSLGRDKGSRRLVLRTTSSPQGYSQAAVPLLTFFLTQASSSDLVSKQTERAKAKKNRLKCLLHVSVLRIQQGGSSSSKSFSDSSVQVLGHSSQGHQVLSRGSALSLLRKAERKSMGRGLDNFGNVYRHVKMPLRI